MEPAVNPYELRVWTSKNITRHPDQTVPFEAVNDQAAAEHMDHFATTLPGTTAVWLWPAGGAQSIASTSGSC